jgi:hypothetical protein
LVTRGNSQSDLGVAESAPGDAGDTGGAGAMGDTGVTGDAGAAGSSGRWPTTLELVLEAEWAQRWARATTKLMKLRMCH